MNTPKENKIKLDLPNDELGKKLRLNIMKNDILGTPSGPLRKKYAIFTSNNTPENKMRFTLDKISKKIIRKDNKLKKIDNINNRILTIKPNKNAYIITETIGNLDYRDSHSIKKNFTIDAKESENLNKSPLMQKRKSKLRNVQKIYIFIMLVYYKKLKKKGVNWKKEYKILLNNFIFIL